MSTDHDLVGATEELIADACEGGREGGGNETIERRNMMDPLGQKIYVTCRKNGIKHQIATGVTGLQETTEENPEETVK
ncbi:hypothetical protein NDU88_003120 [Pleurodeles waltl]|uniref:Uncharacterized protein n=1 Tax=Pleurodeles waltl TaxID=8319 RepID=A0AAV7M4G0_PLEWA|nr:hypothetical protein NDU88_003120 [Pleurodeles waltl]